MADDKPLSDNEANDRLKAALNTLGEAPGVTVQNPSFLYLRPNAIG